MGDIRESLDLSTITFEKRLTLLRMINTGQNYVLNEIKITNHIWIFWQEKNQVLGFAIP